MERISEQLVNECEFKALRSSGPGGQHVNKVNTCIELRFNIESSVHLSTTQKSRLYEKLAGRISKDKILVLTASNERSQIRNREIALTRFINLIENALAVPKVRKRTRATRASKLKRLESKKKQGLKKILRRKPM